ncbi:ImmA/IrrE family metallo-endopeptidase [Fertoebacter nigrum]|uniref:ImmA/IrrE family metallo-endopeptidase n=2 Tax=Fertoeibacter niger TaxID=2656921 RepID=A0A8X8H101_9RHOB|nr:ImmA/IrrE family metallo-endopeptidase [Fertoeibacter niger]
MTDIAALPDSFLRILVPAVRNITPLPVDPDEARRALLLHLQDAEVPGFIIATLRPYLMDFLRDIQSGRLDPWARQAWKAVPAISDTDASWARDRALIDQLIAQTGLYTTGPAIRELFEFTIRLRGFAPFNAMLLHIQKPGLTHAATGADWASRFGRFPKSLAWPILILRVKGPVDFVFDVLDTEGEDLPASAFCFPVLGDMSAARLTVILDAVRHDGIDISHFDGGDGFAGQIQLVGDYSAVNRKCHFAVSLNQNHAPAQQFVTLAHELAHLFLGHLCADPARRVPLRSDCTPAECEAEAESAAYLVARRNGVLPFSEGYLAKFTEGFATFDIYAVMRAANSIETVMGLGASMM